MGFLEFMEEKVTSFPLHVSITYNKICDWTIEVYKKNCAEDYTKTDKRGNDAILCYVQDSDLSLALAKAECEVKEWLLENTGGY